MAKEDNFQTPLDEEDAAARVSTSWGHAWSLGLLLPTRHMTTSLAWRPCTDPIYSSTLPLPDNVAYGRLPLAFTLVPCCVVLAQVLDPVLAPVAAAQRGEAATPPFGIFLKDYMETEW